jgi:hypothetical protein
MPAGNEHSGCRPGSKLNLLTIFKDRLAWKARLELGGSSIAFHCALTPSLANSIESVCRTDAADAYTYHMTNFAEIIEGMLYVRVTIHHIEDHNGAPIENGQIGELINLSYRNCE